MKKSTLISIVLIIAAGLIGYGMGMQKQIPKIADLPSENGEPIAANKEPIKIGAILPLTGKNAEWGERVRKGIIFALKEVNQNQEVISVLYEDSGPGVSAAISATYKLINFDKISVLFCQLSDVCNALSPIAQQNKIVLFGFTDTPSFSETGDYIFNLRGDATQIGKEAGNFAISNYKTVAILMLNNLTGKGIADGFAEIFEAGGGKILFNNLYNDQETDFRTTLAKIVATNPEVLLLGGRPKTAVDLVIQIEELGLSQPIIFHERNGIDTKEFLSLGEAVEGIISPSAIISKNLTADQLKILQNYQERYQEPMPVWTAESYDAIKLLGIIAEQGKDSVLDASKIKSLLATVQDFKGLASTIDFTKTRIPKKEYQMVIIKSGQFAPYEE